MEYYGIIALRPGYYPKVEENCFLGINSTIDQNVKAARNCIIGANLLILTNTVEDGAYITEATKIHRISSKMLRHILNVRKMT